MGERLTGRGELGCNGCAMRKIIATLGLLTLLFAVSACATDRSASTRLDDRKACEEAYKQKDYETAFMECHWIAEQSDAEAQNAVGSMYRFGQGVSRDYVEAVRWLRTAAEQGYARSQSNLGIMYADGLGVSRDNAEAQKWWRKAAEQGNANAQRNLGNMYAYVAVDYVQAYMWYDLAAKHGHRSAFQDRENIARRMFPAQVAEAQRLAREWWAKFEAWRK